MFSKFLRERSRSRAIRALGVANGPAEPDFDFFVQQVADAFAAPIALLNLVDHTSLWIKAAAGMEPRCIAREDSFCTHAVDEHRLLEVCDALVDPVYATLSSVTGAPFIRYYIGAPLLLIDGTAVGALCVVDTQPRVHRYGRDQGNRPHP